VFQCFWPQTGYFKDIIGNLAFGSDLMSHLETPFGVVAGRFDPNPPQAFRFRIIVLRLWVKKKRFLRE
jgi:hypothetical protein